ncbi:SGNH hydrolase [Penicillium capsulatum]|uniref:SGNH hydrolase n=1 Tax=Penicillium capsulatum TaxID=69766 RepID=A0A9W9ID45_9EURO|nr:SGNH hydrolase [Penicillium capsulatum]KAJ6135020.1 SGNH hydrolase [Penicillium capsulatum]
MLFGLIVVLLLATSPGWAGWYAPGYAPSKILNGYGRRMPLQITDMGRKRPPITLKVGFFGDSYSAGPGAGKRLPNDEQCFRYDQSYPMQLHTQFTDLDEDKFVFASCTGAIMPDFPGQLKKLHHKLDALVISFGGKSVTLNPGAHSITRLLYLGNDLGFARIAEVCFMNVHDTSNTLPWSKQCDKLLDEADGKINLNHRFDDGYNFYTRIQQVLKEAKEHLTSRGRIIWTGYGAFFDDSTLEPNSEDPCSKVSWNLVWFSGNNYMTRRHRKRANQLVRDANRVLKGLVQGEKGIFVDWEKQIDRERAERMCAPGSNPAHLLKDGKEWKQLPWEVFIEPNFKESKHGDALKRDLGSVKRENWLPNPFAGVEALAAKLIAAFHPTTRGHFIISRLVGGVLEWLVNAIEVNLNTGHEVFLARFDRLAFYIGSFHTGSLARFERIAIWDEFISSRSPNIHIQRKRLYKSQTYENRANCSKPNDFSSSGSQNIQHQRL